MSYVEIGLGLVTAFGVMIWPNLPKPIMWIGLALGLALIVWGIWQELMKRDGGQQGTMRMPLWVSAWRLHFERDGLLPFYRVIPLGDAARIAYEKTRHTDTGHIAEGLLKNEVLGYYYHALTGNQYYSIYGAHPPSTKMEKIPHHELSSGTFSEDGSAFTEIHDQSPKYVRLAVRRKDLHSYIRKAKAN